MMVWYSTLPHYCVELTNEAVSISTQLPVAATTMQMNLVFVSILRAIYHYVFVKFH